MFKFYLNLYSQNEIPMRIKHTISDLSKDEFFFDDKINEFTNKKVDDSFLKSLDNIEFTYPKATITNLNWSDFELSINELTNALSFEETILDNQKASIRKRLEKHLSIVDSLDKKQIIDAILDDVSKMNHREFYDFLIQYNLDAQTSALLSREYQIIRNSYHLVRSLQRRIKSILNAITKQLRNLRSFFTRNHSFHFKNLDDSHDTALIFQ